MFSTLFCHSNLVGTAILKLKQHYHRCFWPKNGRKAKKLRLTRSDIRVKGCQNSNKSTQFFSAIWPFLSVSALSAVFTTKQALPNLLNLQGKISFQIVIGLFCLLIHLVEINFNSDIFKLKSFHHQEILTKGRYTTKKWFAYILIDTSELNRWRYILHINKIFLYKQNGLG